MASRTLKMPDGSRMELALPDGFGAAPAIPDEEDRTWQYLLGGLAGMVLVWLYHKVRR